MIAEIQCLARPAGTPEDPYKHIEAAIKVIQESGLTFEVDALGTTFEGEPDEVWATLRAAHEATIEAGADGLVSVIKISQTAPRLTGSSISGLTGKFRA